MERIDCSALLPESPTNDLRCKAAPKASSEEDEEDSSPEREEEEEEEEAALSGQDGVLRRRTRGPGEAPGARPSYPCRLTTTRQIPPAEAGRNKKKLNLPVLGEKKRKASPVGETGTSNKGKASLPDYSATAADSEEGWLPRKKPLVRS